MKNIAIIPARGGSKRIPRKNVKPFMGKPIIAYSIEAALQTGLFDEVMVSTDDSEIADVAKQYGASVPFMRSESTANDYATLADVLHEVIDTYSAQGKQYTNACCILATAPFIMKEDIQGAYKKLNDMHCASVQPVVQFSYPILRSLSINELLGGGGYVAYNWPEYARARSQDLAPAYHDAGTFYWHNIQKWVSGDPSRFGFIVDDVTIQDIDTETDWRMAEIKYKILTEIGYFKDSLRDGTVRAELRHQ